ncbi:tRNA (adenosine(37)-N6)-threonylcarbamoyltransferase complex dimerization subunit type 1 TsaB [Floricoccus penangensis]|uniref:tRNA (Adenosine(37)-N6)-threonylcarbamoyltransferase complex dimerization subunit type 1 TsaB n=1 Tax=Floricoccus penangensis TaxID=1859475 RepID=A0A9Q5JFS8_9LACT|nr:tRNA (adenosine(37)-N6)-threonylcarbamoyltransferase complex dimerization subunit type 1 TsaB [Floricoccus penangensis]OFI46447.1 tRNA (adenosine(37)-N6)-threonylcarbamoyltransferase complex dimerization subunit type 1 TsaB [Floricoccus penangensis]
MKILAFDTSSKALAVALVEDGDILGQVTLNIKKNHSITLMPAIDFLMAQVGLKPKDLDRIAVAKGPGSYTGLRIAVTTAKTLAYSLDIELVGVSSLQAMAKNLDTSSLVVPLMDARRKNVYAGAYLNGESVITDRHTSFDDLVPLLQERDEEIVFTGEVDNFIDDISEKLPNARVINDSLLKLPSAYQIALVGVEMEPVEIHTFVPEYLKRVEAEEKWLETHHEDKDTGYINKI